MTRDAVLVLDDADPVTAFAAFLAAVRAGRPALVHDHRWPAAPLRALRRDLAATPPPPGTLLAVTSGSTGRPRVVVRTAASWDASTAMLSALTGTGAGDVVWLPGPLSSTLTLHAAWHAVAAGAIPVLGAAPPADAAGVHVVPAGLDAVVAHRRAGRLPALRVAVVAGDTPDPRRRAAVEGLGVRVVEYYGAAELSFVAARADASGDAVFVPVGGVALEVRPRPQGGTGPGELWACSPYLAQGYLPRADGGRVGGPLRRDDGGWATVGDLADDLGAGRFRLRGRGDGAVTTGGVTVLVADVEAHLRAVDGVGDVLVVGLPHPRLGRLLAALVVPGRGGPGIAGDGDPGRAVDGDALLRRLRARAAALPPAARPRRWQVAAALPRTSSGKPDRAAAVRELAGGGRRA